MYKNKLIRTHGLQSSSNNYRRIITNVKKFTHSWNKYYNADIVNYIYYKQYKHTFLSMIFKLQTTNYYIYIKNTY